jgi:hypothetical protein
VPELAKRNCSTDFTREQISSARRRSLSVGAAKAEPLRICATTASTTRGSAWPRISDV